MTAPDPLVRALMDAMGCNRGTDAALPQWLSGVPYCAEHEGWLHNTNTCAVAERIAASLAPFVAAQRADAKREALTGVRDAVREAIELEQGGHLTNGLFEARRIILAALAALPEVPEEVRRDEPAEPQDRNPVWNIADTCCGKCVGGTCYVDQVTGA